MSENERQSQTNVVINHKLQGTYTSYIFKMWWIVNNQIKENFIAESASEFFLNQWIFGTATGRKMDCVVHFLRLLAMWWPGAQSARDNHLADCNFAKYSLILNCFQWHTQQ